MRICVHDFVGHPFQLDLSRELASRGHAVTHFYSEAVEAPKTTLDGDEASGLEILSVDRGLTFEKYLPFQRARDEQRYGSRLMQMVKEFGPEVVLSSNAPLLAQRRLLRPDREFAMVHWWQDIQSRAAQDRFGGTLLAPAAWVLTAVEKKIARRSDGVVAIADSFKDVSADWGVPGERLTVIPNWAPIQEMPQRPRGNEWARRHGLGDRPTFLYSGTLGLKHNPELLAGLAEELGDEADVVVVSQGLGADYLREAKEARNLDGLTLLPYQPFEELPDVFGTGDVLLAILEPAAGAFSVPSKVLSYLCAGRATLLAVPEENLAAQTVLQAGAGLVVDPRDGTAFVQAARKLLDDPAEREAMGRRARGYAEETFDISQIADRFEKVFEAAIRSRHLV